MGNVHSKRKVTQTTASQQSNSVEYSSFKGLTSNDNNREQEQNHFWMNYSAKQESLVRIPDEIFQFHSLYSLDLSHNQISSIPSQIGQLKNLTRLILMHNCLTSLPKELASLSNLRFLELSYNELEEIPIFLANSNKLTALGISGNRISHLPNEICTSLTDLVQFGIHSNRITQLPECIEHLNQLTKFDVCKNRLSHLPSSISHLSNLIWCNFSHNQLTELPDCLGEMHTLQEIGLAHNRLQSLMPLKGLKSLKTLIVYDNKIDSLPGMLISSWKSLEVLEAGHNEIQTLGPELWQLPNIKRINLKYNFIRRIEVQESCCDSQISILMLQGNRLSSLPLAMTSVITNCEFFSLANNPWNSNNLEEGVKKNLNLPSLGEIVLNCLINKEKQNAFTADNVPKTCHSMMKKGRKCIYCQKLCFHPMHEIVKCVNFSQFGSIPFIGYSCCKSSIE